MNFHETVARYPETLFKGGYGCIDGDTKLFNPLTGRHIKIKVLKDSCVSSYQNDRFQSCLAWKPVKYKKAALYEVRTERGQKIVVTKEHRFMTSSGWQQLSFCDLQTRLLVCGGIHPLTILEFFLSSLYAGVKHLYETIQGLTERCFSCFRLYGGHFQLALDTGVSASPSQADARGHILHSLQKDVLDTRLICSRSYQLSSHASKTDFPCHGQLQSRGANKASYILQKVSALPFVIFLSRALFLANTFLSQDICVFYLRFRAWFYTTWYNHTLRYEKIQAILFKKIDCYYDLHVPELNNYMAAGFVNHNCGKSRAQIEEDIALSMAFPDNLGFIVRKYREDLKGSVKEDFHRWCPPELIKKTYDSGFTIQLINKSVVMLKGLYTHSSSQRSKLGSANLGWVDVHEMDEIAKEDFQDLQGRLRREGIPVRRLYGGCNPPPYTHWLPEYFSDPRNCSRAEVVTGGSYDNPHLPADYLKGLTGAYKNAPGLLKRYIQGEYGFTPKGTPAFQGYSEKQHYVPLKYDKNLPVIRIWDFGFIHPAVVWMQVLANNSVNILGAHMGTKMNLQIYAPIAIRISNEKYHDASFFDICDIAGKQEKDTGPASIKVLNSYGVKPKSKSSSVRSGIELMQRMLLTIVESHPQIRINSTNDEGLLIHEAFVGGYTRDEYGDVIKEDFYEHVMDCTRYGIVYKFMSPVAERQVSGTDIVVPSYNFGRPVQQNTMSRDALKGDLVFARR